MEPEREDLGDVAQVLDDLVTAALRALFATPPSGYYEAELDASVRLLLVGRHVESVAVLARDDKRLLPGAITLTRSAYEIALRILWLLQPEQPMEREARWLAAVHEREQSVVKAARRVASLGADPAPYQSFAERLQQHRLTIAAKLPAHIAPPNPPKFADILRDLGEERKYPLYAALSQFSHGTHEATTIYQHHVDGGVWIHDRIAEAEWVDVLQIGWYAVDEPTRRLLELLGGDVAAFARERPISEMNAAVVRLRAARDAASAPSAQGRSSRARKP
jgi:hypothetical protein